jgi:hypothetical protein
LWPDRTIGISEFWSNFNLERDKSNLPINEFKTEVFRLIGMLLEASVQPFLRDLVAQVRISKRKTWDQKAIRKLSLGNLVEELSASGCPPELIAPVPWNIRLNQWRNISQHHLARVEGEVIVLSKEATKTGAEVRLSRTDALLVAGEMISLFTAVKSASDIVSFDRTDASFCFHDEHGIREEALLLHFNSAISTQGFELLDLETSELSVRADMGDIIVGDVVSRVAHASQLLKLLYAYTHRSAVEIRYFDRKGHLRATMRADGLIAEGSSTCTSPDEFDARVVVRFCSDEFVRDPILPELVRHAPKVGRNDPCPCKSGRKYKKCCGR